MVVIKRIHLYSVSFVFKLDNEYANYQYQVLLSKNPLSRECCVCEYKLFILIYFNRRLNQATHFDNRYIIANMYTNFMLWHF